MMGKLSSPSNPLPWWGNYHHPLTFCHDGKIIAVITIWPNARMRKTFWPTAMMGQSLSPPFDPSTGWWKQSLSSPFDLSTGWWEQSLSSPFDSYCHDHSKNHPHHLLTNCHDGKTVTTTLWSITRMMGKIILITLWPEWWWWKWLSSLLDLLPWWGKTIIILWSSAWVIGKMVMGKITITRWPTAMMGRKKIIITLWSTAWVMGKWISSLFDLLP